VFESIIYAFALIFILCGMFFVCLLIFDRVITPKEAENYIPLIPGLHNDEFLPMSVYSAFVRANLFTFSKNTEVIVLDMGLDENEKRECENMLEGTGTVLFCTENEIAKLFVERAKKK